MSDPIVLRWSWVWILQAALAAAIFVFGIPATVTALHDLGFYSRVHPDGSLGGRQQVGESATDLAREIPQTAAERRDLAFAFLSHGNDPDLSEAAQTLVVKRAVEGFREYLAQVPADGQAWAGLASAQIRLHDLDVAAEALRMSILTAPWSNSLVQWRCGMAIDLFRTLNSEEWELMKGQFRVAAQRSVSSLVRTVIGRNGTGAARIFLASSPNELIKFEAELAYQR